MSINIGRLHFLRRNASIGPLLLYNRSYVTVDIGKTYRLGIDGRYRDSDRLSFREIDKDKDTRRLLDRDIVISIEERFSIGYERCLRVNIG